MVHKFVINFLLLDINKIKPNYFFYSLILINEFKKRLPKFISLYEYRLKISCISLIEKLK